jgi:hypothetical protein
MNIYYKMFGPTTKIHNLKFLEKYQRTVGKGQGKLEGE